jgi:50S ribosomal protein L16 3-hydroxylase
MGITLGTNPQVLSPAVDCAMIRALRASTCKVLVSLGDGEHREVMLPPGDDGSGLGGTRCYMNLEATVPELLTLLRPTEVAEGAVGRVNAYLSYAGSGAPLHFDMRAVWIIQLVGSKLWMVSKTPAVANPHRNCVARSDSPWVDYDGTRLEVPTDFLYTVLRPGEWLFIPKAFWHATYSAEGSVSATLAEPKSSE